MATTSQKKLVVGINTLTLFGIMLSIGGLFFVHSYIGFILILTSMIIDLFDGHLARKCNGTTQTGAVLDSINDVVIYLLFPCVYILTSLDIQYFPNWIIVFSLICNVIAGGYRLMRHSKHGFAKKGYYCGLPVYFNFILIILWNLKYIFNYTLFIPLFLTSSLILGMLFISKLPIKKFTIPQSILLIGFMLLFYILWQK